MMSARLAKLGMCCRYLVACFALSSLLALLLPSRCMLEQGAQQGPDRLKEASRSRKNATSQAINGLDHSLQTMLGFGLERFLPGRADVGAERPPAIKLVVDQSTINFSTANLLLYGAGIRGVAEADPLHRSWDDFKCGLKAAGFWGTLAKGTVVCNVNYGPFLSADYFQMKAEVAEELQQNRELMAELREDIAFDRGADPDDSDDPFTDARTFAVKGIYVKHKVWWAVTAALEALDRDWTLTRHALAHIEGVAVNDELREQPEDENPEGGDADADADAATNRNGGSDAENLKALWRSKQKTLAVAVELMADRDLQKRLRMICEASRPLRSEFEEMCKSQAEPEQAGIWYARRGSGEALIPVQRILATLQNWNVLSRLGFSDDVCRSVDGASQLHNDEYWEAEESALAEEYSSLVLSLVAQRCWTQLPYSQTLPSLFATIFHPLHERRGEGMNAIRKKWDARPLS